jgi:hypothetical protein
MGTRIVGVAARVVVGAMPTAGTIGPLLATAMPASATERAAAGPAVPATAMDGVVDSHDGSPPSFALDASPSVKQDGGTERNEESG